MNHSDIAALMKGVAPVIRDLIAASVRPLLDEIADLKRELAEVKAVDQVATIRSAVADAVAALPPARDGKDGAPGRDGADGEPGRDGVDGRDGAPGRDGERGADGIPGRDGIDGKEGAAGRDGINGADGAPGRDGVDGAPGRDGAPGKDGEPGANGKDGADGRDGERGADGAPGKLPLLKDWTPGVHYEADVVAHKGGAYQARKDTAQEPGGEEWICLAAPGRDGVDGRSFNIRGTYAEGVAYNALDVVSLNGGAFVAKTDDPGPCPGAGWQLMASQGKVGKPGERGAPGRGDRGEAGPPVLALHVDEQGMLTLVNADGSEVRCDLYPLLSKVN